jgi:hypothetical protein
LAISLAIALGYKKIVLCGFDMTGTGYFWDEDGFQVRSGFSKPNLEKKSLHGTVDDQMCPVTLDKVICAINDIYRCKGVTLYTSTPTSKLSSILPVYRWS